MALPYFRLYSKIIDNYKIHMLPENMRWRFIGLLCLRCREEKITNEVAAFCWRIPIEEAEETRKLFMAQGFIDENWTVLNWDKWQHSRPERLPSNLWNIVRFRIFRRDDFTCQYCGERGKELECDHIVPVSRGGSHDDDNLVTACKACNRSKRARLVSEWGGR